MIATAIEVETHQEPKKRLGGWSVRGFKVRVRVRVTAENWLSLGAWEE